MVSTQNGCRTWFLSSLGSVRVNGSSALKNDRGMSVATGPAGRSVASIRNRSAARFAKDASSSPGGSWR